MDAQDQLIFDKLKDMLLTIKPKMDQSSITEDAHLISDLGMDSLSMLLIMLAIENEFGISISGNTNFNTVRQVIEFIRKESQVSA